MKPKIYLDRAIFEFLVSVLTEFEDRRRHVYKTQELEDLDDERDEVASAIVQRYCPQYDVAQVENSSQRGKVIASVRNLVTNQFDIVEVVCDDSLPTSIY